ncbi:hypothetical protein U1Q18_035982 [Sarracenia purpurea var. burkii]
MKFPLKVYRETAPIRSSRRVLVLKLRSSSGPIKIKIEGDAALAASTRVLEIKRSSGDSDGGDGDAAERGASGESSGAKVDSSDRRRFR